MFKITKATKNSSSILKTLNALGITVQDKDRLNYFKEVFQQRLFVLEPLQELKLKTQYDETDARYEGCEVHSNCEIRVEESIQGTGISGTFVINQREDFRGHDRSIYSIKIHAGGGNVEIIGNHSGLFSRSSIYTWGGDGIDQFVST